jgi:Amt family ammonium transporter
VVTELQLDSGDTAWLLISTALVMLMTPGLAFFYGGLTRNKNVLGTIMQSFICLGLITVLWVIVGYSLAFGEDRLGGFVGDPRTFFGMKDVKADNAIALAPTVPHQAYMLFQLMFAIITPALITGAFAERAKFSAVLLFLGAWSLFVYAPIAHWVWGGGWLGSIGWLGDRFALDFAGGTVVHINAGIAALVAAVLFGKRLGFGKEPMEPHDITMVVLGAALLWFGWFGFNAGSAVAANGLASNAFMSTHIATAAAALAWTGLSWVFLGKPSVVGAAAGAVAGLVAITPAAGFVDAMPALVIGIGAGAFCYFAVRARAAIGLDDSLDVVGVHGVGGVWGALATGLFASTAAAGFGANGLLEGEPMQFVVQLVAVGVTIAYSGAVTLVILKAIDLLVGLRVTEAEEALGLDASQHGERAYVFDMGSLGVPAAAPSYMVVDREQAARRFQAAQPGESPA